MEVFNINNEITAAKEKHCLPKKIIFSAPLAEPLGHSPPKCQTQCLGQTSVPVRNFS